MKSEDDMNVAANDGLWDTLIKQYGYHECQATGRMESCWRDCDENCRGRITTDVEEIEVEILFVYGEDGTHPESAIVKEYTKCEILTYLHNNGIDCHDCTAETIAVDYIASLRSRMASADATR